MVEGLTSSAADQGSVAGIAIDPDKTPNRRSHAAPRARAGTAGIPRESVLAMVPKPADRRRGLGAVRYPRRREPHDRAPDGDAVDTARARYAVGSAAHQPPDICRRAG